MLEPIIDVPDEYLRDESRETGYAGSIAFPRDENGVGEALEYAAVRSCGITVQGGRTGLDGLAVPHGGHIINCSRLCEIKSLREGSGGSFLLRAGGGLTLSELEDRLIIRSFDTRDWDKESLFALDKLTGLEQLFWPPAPSERGATIAGAVCTDARGPLSYGYGGVLRYAFDIKRVGQVITELTLKLLPSPGAVWGIAFFFENEAGALGFAGAADSSGERCIAALDYFDRGALNCVSALRNVSSGAADLPEIGKDFQSAVFVELHAPSDEAADRTATKLLSVAENNGSDTDASWVLTGFTETGRIRMLRHTAQEAVLAEHDRRWQNEPVRPAIGVNLEQKKPRELDGIINTVKSSGLESAIFGCACNGRIRLSLLPEGVAQYEAAKKLIAQIKLCP